MPAIRWRRARGGPGSGRRRRGRGSRRRAGCGRGRRAVRRSSSMPVIADHLPGRDERGIDPQLRESLARLALDGADRAAQRVARSGPRSGPRSSGARPPPASAAAAAPSPATRSWLLVAASGRVRRPRFGQLVGRALAVPLPPPPGGVGVDQDLADVRLGVCRRSGARRTTTSRGTPGGGPRPGSGRGSAGTPFAAGRSSARPRTRRSRLRRRHRPPGRRDMVVMSGQTGRHRRKVACRFYFFRFRNAVIASRASSEANSRALRAAISSPCASIRRHQVAVEDPLGLPQPLRRRRSRAGADRASTSASSGSAGTARVTRPYSAASVPR